jgi:murein DD-endopeptidase MepM/ murein hydrolase activator NlpD
LVSDIKPIFDLRKLNVGMKISCFFNGENLSKFQYQINDNTYLFVKGDKNKYSGIIKKIPYVIKKEVVSGVISYSLFNSILKNGERPELADMMASLYEYDIDFNRDLRKGDKYSLLIEKKFLKGVFKGYGKIIAANFIQKEHSIKVVLFAYKNHSPAYYHPDGRAVKKMFLKSPLPFMRVTSRYGMRKHPILKFSTKHNGVDLGAPRGTKVKVTASGMVIKAGYNRVKGRYVEVRHPNRYVTQYFHLSGIKRGIRRGVRVIQGQFIGYVGSTGRSTGPHLHYGVKKSNRFINPLRLKSPKKNPIAKKYLDDFKKYAQKALYILNNGGKGVDETLLMKSVLIKEIKTMIAPVEGIIGII